jgi:hypothetical protein
LDPPNRKPIDVNLPKANQKTCKSKIRMSERESETKSARSDRTQKMHGGLSERKTWRQRRKSGRVIARNAMRRNASSAEKTKKRID